MFRAIQIRLQLLVLGSSTSVLVCSTESGAFCSDNGGENSMAQYLLVTTISHDRHTRIVLNIARGPGSGLRLHIDMLCYVCPEKDIPCNETPRKYITIMSSIGPFSFRYQYALSPSPTSPRRSCLLRILLPMVDRPHFLSPWPRGERVPRSAI